MTDAAASTGPSAAGEGGANAGVPTVYGGLGRICGVDGSHVRNRDLVALR